MIRKGTLLLLLLVLLLFIIDSSIFSQQGKDLVPLNISFDPSSPIRKGDIVQVTTEVKNQGSQPVGFPSEQITVQFSYLGAGTNGTFATITKEAISLDPGDEITFTANLDTLRPGQGKSPLSAGTYRIFVQVDPQGEIGDENSTNNLISTPSAGPNLVIVKGPTKPDLLLNEIIFSPGSIIAQGGEVKSLIITATVSNSGTFDASPSEVDFSYRLKGESLFRSLGTAGTDELQRREAPKPAFLVENVSGWKAGVYIIRAQVDPQNSQDELDEGNNLLSRPLFIIDTSRLKWSYPRFPIPLPETKSEDRKGSIEAGATVAQIEEDHQVKTVIYFGSDDGHLYAIYADGSERWQYPQDGAIGAVTTKPMIAQDEIYFGSDDGYLYAIDSNGDLTWKYQAGGAVKAAPALLTDSEGTVSAIYFGSDDGHLYSLDSQGNLRWQFATGAFIRTTPAIATVTEGGKQRTMIYFGSGDGNLYALEDRGDKALLRWTFPTGGFIKSSPKIYNGTIYFGSSDGHLYALFLDGTKKWEYPQGPIGAVESTPLVAEEDDATVIYFGSNDGSLYKLEDEGNEGADKWQFNSYEGTPLGPVRSSPVRQGDLIYFGSDDGILYAVRDRGATVSDEWGFPTRGAITGSPAIEGDTLYLSSWEGHLYALNLESID